MQTHYMSAAFPKQKFSRYIQALVASAVLTLVGASQAEAACHVNPGFQTKIVSMDMGTIVVDDTMPVGSVLKERTFSIDVRPGPGGYEEIASCKPGGGKTIGTMDQGTPTNIEGVYTTAVPGIGIRLTRFIGGGATPAVYPHEIHYNALLHPSFYPDAGFKVELIKTADAVGSGPLASGTYTTYYADGDGRTKPIMITRLIGSGTSIVTPACTLDGASKNITVPLGDVATSDFKGPGTTSTAKPFEIKLNCQAKPQPQSILMQFDAAADTATTAEGVIKLTEGENSASGVGIRLLRGNGNPVPLNTQWLDGKSPAQAGPYTMPFQAQYYQTTDMVKAGAANGTATFTITYE